MKSKVILIAGATASGKSGLAIHLAQALAATIINADSMQVYNTLQLLSARPSEAEMAGVSHKLYGFLDPSTPYSVAQWHDDAMTEIKKAQSAKSIPILVGGTGLYFKSLLDGLTVIPEINPQIRDEVRALLQNKGAQYIHTILQDEDPDTAARLDKNDSQRLARALEVIRSTGISLHQWQQKPQTGGLAGADENNDIIKLVVERSREDTYGRIDKRLLQMVDAGALDEVVQLKKMNLPADSLAMKALGVPSFMSYLAEEKTLDEALTEAQTLTRRYAKRQMTWLRNQFSNWRRLDPTVIKSLSQEELLRIVGL